MAASLGERLPETVWRSVRVHQEWIRTLAPLLCLFYLLQAREVRGCRLPWPGLGWAKWTTADWSRLREGRPRMHQLMNQVGTPWAASNKTQDRERLKPESGCLIHRKSL